MKLLLNSLITLSLSLSMGNLFAWEPDNKDSQELAVAKAILDAKAKDPELVAWFDHSAGYAVFPKVGKGGIGIGGARGKGIVIQNDVTIGTVTLTQLSIGLQIGGQTYAEYIFFKDQTALDDFKRGNFELGAQVSAVTISVGASKDANYSKGVAVFTIAGGGLMYEASVGGQKFHYKSK
jgi:lipid-binding SYLF domain-containing protein